jgi:hypothetical protein
LILLFHPSVETQKRALGTKQRSFASRTTGQSAFVAGFSCHSTGRNAQHPVLKEFQPVIVFNGNEFGEESMERGEERSLEGRQ